MAGSLDAAGIVPLPARARGDRPMRSLLCTGKHTVNSVRPGSLATEMSPPCAFTTAAAIARPRPVLPARRDRDVTRRRSAGPGSNLHSPHQMND